MKKNNFLIGISIILYFFSLESAIADVEITLSPGDEYIATVGLYLNSVSRSRSGNMAACVGFTTTKGDCGLDSSYENSRYKVNANIYSSNINIIRRGISYSNFWSGGRSVKCELGTNPSQYSKCNVKRPSVFLSNISTTGTSSQYKVEATLKTIAIKTNINTTPGTLIIPLSIRAIDNSRWIEKASGNVKVTIRSTTCRNFTGADIDVGSILPGQKVEKPLDLRFSCDNPILGASWKYDKTVVNDNVEVKVKKESNYFDSSISYPLSDVQKLNGLNVEIKAKNDAKPSDINVKLKFTVKYS